MAKAKPAQPLLVRPAASEAAALPRLENGDRLAATEFLRRYDAMPGVKKAELINGAVFMPSPLSYKHADADMLLHGWLFTYAARTPGVAALANPTVRLSRRDVPQPDAVLRLINGATSIGRDGFLTGPPELIVEIATSTAAMDLHAKLQLYRRAGVREYLVWSPSDYNLDWFRLRDGAFNALQPDKARILHSRFFPGLALSIPALADGDSRRLIAALDSALRSPAHRAFVSRLAER